MKGEHDKMNIVLDEKVEKYMQQKHLSALIIEMTPVGCSCVGIHNHAEPDYLETDKIAEYEKKESYELYVWKKEIKVFIEKDLLPCNEISILGTYNPFNKRVYMHCEIK